LCLFASQGHDLRSLVRQGASDAQLSAAIAQIWHGRDDRYSELRGAQQGTSGSGLKRVEMSYIGG
jgi:cyclic pyranopterin phosphate synthase